MKVFSALPEEIDGKNVKQYKDELKKAIAEEAKYARKGNRESHYYSFLSSDIEKVKIISALKSGKTLKSINNAYTPSKKHGVPKSRFSNYVRLFNSQFKDTEFNSDDELFSCFEICVAICEIDKREASKKEYKEYNRKYGTFRLDNIVKVIPFILAVLIFFYLNSWIDDDYERKKKRKFCETVNPNLNLSTSLKDIAQCDIMYEQHLKWNQSEK